MKYKTIVADPPWDVMAGPAFNPDGISRFLSYKTMSVEEIKNMNIESLCSKDAHLYLWVINKYLEQSYEVARSWGFKLSTMLVWCKNSNGIGLGGTYSLSTEFILFCRRGTHKAIKRIDTNWFNWKRGKHSQKPEAFQDIIETISPGPYLELFARRERPGWDVFGDEVENSIKIESKELTDSYKWIDREMKKLNRGIRRLKGI